MVHGATDIDIAHIPPTRTECFDDNETEVFFIDGIVRAKSCGVIIEDYLLTFVVAIVLAEIFN